MHCLFGQHPATMFTREHKNGSATQQVCVTPPPCSSHLESTALLFAWCAAHTAVYTPVTGHQEGLQHMIEQHPPCAWCAPPPLVCLSVTQRGHMHLHSSTRELSNQPMVAHVPSTCIYSVPPPPGAPCGVKGPPPVIWCHINKPGRQSVSTNTNHQQINLARLCQYAFSPAQTRTPPPPSPLNSHLDTMRAAICKVQQT
jgi:hypothetical protein